MGGFLIMAAKRHIRYPMPTPKPGVKPVRSTTGWTREECTLMTNKFYKKNRQCNCTSLIGHDGLIHDTWAVPRSEIHDFLEILFFERITVQVYPLKHTEAGIIFINDEPAELLLKIIPNIPKAKYGDF